jgi:glycosyltransferase A (GT-A) superfamily protein (DUF2064 family)
MAELFRIHSSEGFERIVLRGTDSPTLPLERIDEAFAALERADLALCPDRDGGYNLIGLRGACDGLFALEFSHAGVLLETLSSARALGLRAELLPAHHDVDTYADCCAWPRARPATHSPHLDSRDLLPLTATGCTTRRADNHAAAMRRFADRRERDD